MPIRDSFRMYFERKLNSETEEIEREADRLETPHGEEVGHHGGEAGREAALCDEAQFQFC